MILHNKKTILFIFIAFLFSFSMRLIWVEQFSSTEQFKFNNEFMINTNDGYHYAEGARDILAGNTVNTNDRSPFTSSPSVLTAFLVDNLPFSFETILFYMPAFFASLLVIPLILIGKKFNNLEFGFISALLASIAWSYYNRTMVGYYDTDMLNIVFPTILLWSLIWAIDTKKDIYLLLAAIDIIAYRWWYPQSYALEFSFFALIILYLIYLIFKYKNRSQKLYQNKEIAYVIQLVTIMIIAMVQLDMQLRMMLVFGYFMLFRQERWHKHLYIMFVMTLILFMATGGLSPILNKLQHYIFTDTVAVYSEGLKLHFYTVMQTIREAGKISFETFANRISGHSITFILSVLGYVWLCYRHKIMILALPMLGLGFLALSGGLRFTIYAVPVMAMGIAFLICEVSGFISKQFTNAMIKKVVHYLLLSFFTLLVLYPNIKHIISYKIPTVFTKNEVTVLDKLKNIANREDYVISWWDYGYPIKYYSNVKTLIDGGKHSGVVNFSASFILTSPQEDASKMARLDVEYTEMRFNATDSNLTLAASNIEQMTLDYGYDNTNDFLYALETELILPKKTRDIYLYLPQRLLNILPTVDLFSNIDLMTGTQGHRPFFYQTTDIQQENGKIDLGSGVFILKDKAEIQIANQKVKIKDFVITQYDQNGKLYKSIQSLNNDGDLSVIYMKDYNTFLVLDNKLYSSTYIQLFVLENYDSDLFEPLMLTPLSKVYKLKI